MTLIFVLLTILLVPYALFTVLDGTGVWHSTPRWRGMLCLSIVFLFTGTAHFTATTEMVKILPSWVPYRTLIVYLSGLIEFAAAIGLWMPRLTRLIGILLLIFLAAVFPANIYAAVNRIDVGGQGGGPLFLLIRAPMQLALMAWIWFFTVRKSP